ncbi:ABC transporter permease [Curtobacterium ammoniigenes]|uniref:ABC transporter permease n=1 Tax=Curtobacterium ammoniigenes TaxID=395387 RepID=UPI0014707A4D|nr:ABC transporter permease [Curtobacterium ammoniigenes]
MRGFPVRNGLTAASLVVGLVGLVSVSAASTTVQATSELRAVLTGGAASTFVGTGPTGFVGQRTAEFARQALLRFPGYDAAAVRIDVPDSSIRVNGADGIATDLHFVSSDLIAIRRFPVLDGTWLSDDVSETVAVNAALATTASASLGRSVEARIAGEPVTFRVGGVIEDGSTAPALYVSLHRSDLLAQSQAASVSLELTGPALDAPTVRGDLARLSALDGSGAQWNVARQDTVDTVADALRVTRVSFTAVGVLGLLSAVIGIVNVGASAVRERASEMALRRSLGARPRYLALALVIESQLIAITASMIAVPMSVVGHRFIAAALGAPPGVTPPHYPWNSAWIALGVSCSAALIGSVVPAVRASRVSMTTVMRE